MPGSFRDRKMSEALLRKRPRPASITRTTSKAELSSEDPTETEEYNKPKNTTGASSHPAPLSPKGACQKPQDFARPLHFLRSCGVCRRPLGLAQDIYIYRGDAAFCSTECREQRMNYDSLKGTSSHQ